MIRIAPRIPLILIVALLGGCTTWWQFAAGNSPRQEVSSSLVDYLYPQGMQRERRIDLPAQLELPLRVGLAFVPAHGNDLPEATRSAWLAGVQSRFEAQSVISSIEVIPDAYLRGSSGFRSIEQIAQLHGLDVMALISYDQIAIADDTTSSLLYWTIVGAYFVEGSQNDVNTFVDIAIFDVATRKLLLRAPGRNNLQATSTLIRSPEEMRNARSKSFSLAIEQMTDNLDDALLKFKAEVNSNPDVQVAAQSGAGGLPWSFALLLLVVLLVARGR